MPIVAKPPSLEYMRQAVEYWLSGANNNKLQWTTVKNKYRLVNHRTQLYRWKKYVERNGNKRQKLEGISSSTIGEFNTSRNKGYTVHDRTLKRYALRSNLIHHLPNFKASPSWVLTTKKTNNIKSRKVTNILTKAQLHEKADLKKQADDFVAETRSGITHVSTKNIYNTDQTSFQKEMMFGRTLEFKGTKKVYGVVTSKNAVTHTFTVQPTITMDGRVLPKTLLVLQEATELSTRVLESMVQPNNLNITWSKSGKCTKEIVKKYYQDVLIPCLNEKSILIQDSWNGQTDERVLQQCLEESGKQVIMKNIPKGTTGEIQPLDKLGFRPMKNFARTLSGNIHENEDTDYQFITRNNTIKFTSVVINQFSSPRFRDLILTSLFNTGYADEKPISYDTPTNFCFSNIETEKCHTCHEYAIIQCAWCKLFLCFHHLFEVFHECDNYIE